MRPLDAAQVLDVWERAWSLSPIDRALALWAAGSGRDDVADASIGAREHGLLALREALFGPTIDAVASCPACAQQIEIATDARKLAGEATDAGDVVVSEGGLRVRCRPPTSADVAAVGAHEDPTEIRDALARRCVLSARRGSKDVDPAALPQSTLEEIERAVARAEPGADIRFDLSCPACGHAWEAAFNAGAFLWSEVDALARGLAVDVHVLASAYGWSEADILDLSPTRRRLYVEVASQ